MSVGEATFSKFAVDDSAPVNLAAASGYRNGLRISITGTGSMYVGSRDDITGSEDSDVVELVAGVQYFIGTRGPVYAIADTDADFVVSVIAE